ncbi:MAG: SBBP repeat-containing protein [Anaerolineae bacterium]|nr:SBBP repeat-containing protein [Anaerolineae bacterium]
MKFRLAFTLSFLLALGLIAGMAYQQSPSAAIVDEPPDIETFGTAFFVYDAQDDVFYTQGTETLIAIDATGVTLYRPDEVFALEFVGADPKARPSGEVRQAGVVNLYHGDQPTTWREQMPIFAEVLYKDLYPGITLRYALEQGGLKSEFLLEPGVDPAQIAVRYQGAGGLSLSTAGDLHIASTLKHTASLVEQAPIVYQSEGERQNPLRAAFRLLDEHTYGFTLLEEPDATRPLVIDPLLIYSSYLGGPQDDGAWAVTLDPDNAIYVTGVTWSYSFPPEYNPNLRPQKKIYVAKLTPSGTLSYVTFLGGSETTSEEGNAIGTDSAGNVYVSGETFSPDFPVLNAWQPTFAGDEDAYLLKLSPTGTLAYSTFLGGTESEEVNDMHVTADGTVYLGGEVYSDDFPLLNPWQSQTFGWDDEDAFLSIFNPAGNLIYSTFFGSNARDQIFRLTVDAAGVVYASGMTSSSTGFPLVDPVQGVYGGEWDDAFVLKLNPWTNQLLFSTYLGGAGRDEAYGIDIDSAGNIYVAGGTSSYNFPLRAPLQGGYGGGTWDAFLAKFDGITHDLVSSTYLGGAGYDFAHSLKLDSGDNVYVVGDTESPNFPTQNPLQATLNGPRDAFLLQMDVAGVLQYASYFGGNNEDQGLRMTIREDRVVTIVGQTRSPDFPLQNAQQTTLNGPRDGFVAQFGIVPTPSPTPPPTPTASPTPTPTPGPASTVIAPEGGSLIHEYPGHQTQLLIPAGVLNASTTFTISYHSFLAAQGALEGNLQGIDHFFEIQMGATPMPFSPPVELRMNYDGPIPIISGTLGLYRLEAGTWITDGITVTHQTAGQIYADIRSIGLYGLLGRTNRIFLPVVLRTTQ